ncbi:hypothetical protein FOZ61_003624 [Perkinsus olseni]|uniref:Uncharacterized protein n=1 Tax=Perkinsus olseni TaxID=32597 RepID=A0A7J6LP76_PEROL|nr:hypothetical protein FOZ61_003624 [Perkinsus olseni]
MLHHLLANLFVLCTTVAAFGTSIDETPTSANHCEEACSQTVGCERSYCKANGVCFGLYHKGDSKCYQPGASDGYCDDATLEPVRCVDYPQTTCSEVCNSVDGCKSSVMGTYCKDWLESPVCFGIITKGDGTLCFAPTDNECEGDSYPCEIFGTTEAPVDTTEAPVDTTEAPVDTTEAPVETTEAPVETTEAPVETTEAPVETTEAPVETTEAPVDTTEAPVDTTEAPVETTEAPVDTTEAPVDTTEPSIDTADPAQPSVDDVEGDWCGDTPLGAMRVTLREDGTASIFISGQPFTATYYLDGYDIIIQNPDESLQSLLTALDTSLVTRYTPEGISVELVNLFSTTLSNC